MEQSERIIENRLPDKGREEKIEPIIRAIFPQFTEENLKLAQMRIQEFLRFLYLDYMEEKRRKTYEQDGARQIT